VKLSDFDKARELKRQVDEVSLQIALVESRNGLGVTIKGTYQDEVMLDAVQASVLKELERRREVYLSELVKIGVMVTQ
jgi:hypothetical protein